VTQALLLTVQQFISKLGRYLVSKASFVHFVLHEWLMFQTNLTQFVQEGFHQLDQLHNRGGLNDSQFFTLLEQFIGADFRLSYGLKTLPKSQFFGQAVQSFETQTYLVSQELVSMETALKLITDKNLLVYPFAGYYHYFKYVDKVQK